MIRKLLVIGVLCIFALSITSAGTAQERQKKDNQFGITLGYTAGYQLFSPDPPAVDNNPDTKPHKWTKSLRPGYAIGLNVERVWRGNIHFAPELLLVKTGDKFYHMDKETSYKTLRKTEFTNYFLIVPLTFKYYIRRISIASFVPYIVAGPELAYLIKSKQEPYIISGDPNDTDAKKWLKTSTWGFSVGTGFSYKMPNSPLTFFSNLRWTRSFQHYNNTNPAFDPKAKINYTIIMLTFGARF